MALNVKQTGGGPALVLLHGLFGSLENLGMIARKLAGDFTVYSVDLPNHGRSPHQDDTSLVQMASVLDDWLAAEGLTEVRLFGHSLGGKVAMELALTQPNRVSQLAVADIAPVAYEARHTQVFAGLLSLDLSQIQTRSQADDALARYVPELPVRSFLLKNLVKEPDGYRWRMNLPVLHRCYSALLAANHDSQYPGPTLFLKGAQSNYITAAHQSAINSRFPAAQVRIIADTGHWLHAEKPDLVARTLLRFFR